MPEEFREYQKSWKVHHPSWEFHLWTEDNLPNDLRRPEVYDRNRVPAERSDIIRFDLLYRFGGVYMDTDFECVRPIDPLLEDVEFFAALLKPGGRVNNAIFGAELGHPLLDRALVELRPQEIGAAEFDKTASGPLFLSALLQGRREVTIFDAEMFYPTTPEQRETAYAIHHAARSWKDPAGWKQAALRAEERLDKERRAHAKTKKALEALKEEMAIMKARVKKAEKQAKSGAPPSEPGAEEPPKERRGPRSFLRARS